MKKRLYSAAVLLSAISFSAISADPSLLLERLNKEHIISAEPQSPFTVDQSGAARATKPSSQVPTKQQTTQKKDASEQEIRELKRQLVALRRETETLRKKQNTAAPVQPKNDTGNDDKQQQPLAISNENKQLQQQLQASEKQLAEANSKREEANHHVNDAAKKMSEQALRITTLKDELKQRSEEKAQAEQQLAGVKKQNAEISTKLQQAETKTAEQEKQLADANKKRDEVTGQLAVATKKVTEQMSQLTALEEKLKQSGEEKAHMEQQLAAAKSAPPVAENGVSKASSPVFSLATDKSELARVNYAWGVWFAAKVQLESETLKDIGQQFMPRAFLQGLQDKFAGSLQMPDADLGKVLSTLNKQVDEARQRDIARNKKQGQQLLADAAKLKGAVRADNGVVYLVEKRGPGAAIGDNDVIRFKVDEKVSSGQVLAQSEVNTARVSELPVVMRMGVKKLVVGGRVKIYVPTELAYGEEGIPGAVPPGVTSVMTLEVLGIEK